jgi:hypothetical protein
MSNVVAWSSSTRVGTFDPDATAASRRTRVVGESSRYRTGAGAIERAI